MLCQQPTGCKKLLQDRIQAVSLRVSTSNETLDDADSAQYRASEWLLEECDAAVPIDTCAESQMLLNEQRYALAVMYFSMGGEGWNEGSNPNLDEDAGEGTWLSGLDYCDWGTTVTGWWGKQLICDDFGNVLKFQLGEFNIRGRVLS